MARNRSLFITTVIVLVFSSACSLVGGPVVGSGSVQDPTAAIETRAAELVASTAEGQTAIAQAVAATLAAMVTNTPELTTTPSLTYTPSFTLTPELPLISISVQTNCRSGPGTVYDVLGIMNVGETAQVVGRNAVTDNWIIRLPSNPAVTCWLWGKYATVLGNTAELPNIDPPPTPTPRASPTQPPDFQLTYDSAPYCASWVEWNIFVKIVNSGGLTWKSYQLAETDGTIHLTSTVSGNIFMAMSKCGGGGHSDNLGPGEAVIISAGHFDDNPFGHHFSATLKVCSEEGMAGSCLAKTITFVP